MINAAAISHASESAAIPPRRIVAGLSLRTSGPHGPLHCRADDAPDGANQDPGEQKHERQQKYFIEISALTNRQHRRWIVAECQQTGDLTQF